MEPTTSQSTLMTVISVPSMELLSERVATFTQVHDEPVGALRGLIPTAGEGSASG
jgi:hypothetical protein